MFADVHNNDNLSYINSIKCLPKGLDPIRGHYTTK